MKNLKILLNFRKLKKLNAENPRNFLNARRVLTVIRSGEAGQQIWAMVKEANNVFGMVLPMACFDNISVKKIEVILFRGGSHFLFTPRYIEL